MATRPDYAPRFEFGRVIARATGAIGRNGPALIGLAIIISGGATFLLGLGRMEGMARGQAAFGLAGVLVFIVSALANAVLQASIIRATILDLSGRRAQIGECLRAGLGLLLPVIGVTIVYSLGVGVASLALVVPGIIVAVMWSVAIPALVEERQGVLASLARSRALTKGARWPIFGLMLLYVVALMVIGGLQATILLAFAGLQILALILNAVGSAVLALFWSVVTAAIYIELREVKEGATSEELADIFA